MSDNQKFSITVPTTIVQRLDAMAAMSGDTRTDVVNRLIVQALAQNIDALSAAKVMSARLSKDVREGLAEIRDAVQTGPATQVHGDEVASGALPPKLALLLVEIAARVTQPDKTKLEATRAAYRNTYLK